MSAIKASQLLSQNLSLAALLEQFIAIASENAGAERGAVILNQHAAQPLFVEPSELLGSEEGSLSEEQPNNSPAALFVTSVWSFSERRRSPSIANVEV